MNIQEIDRALIGIYQDDHPMAFKILNELKAYLEISAIEADRKRRGEPDWEAIKGKRMSDLSASQQEDARELWLREQWRWFGEGESRPGDHIKFLLDRLDAVRAPQPAERDEGPMISAKAVHTIVAGAPQELLP